MRVKKKSAFTILEILIASSFTVLIVMSSVVGINSVLDYKKNENSKPKLLLEANYVLNLIEQDLTNKCTSTGNLLLKQQSYPLRSMYWEKISDFNKLKFGFYRNSENGPQLVFYRTEKLPTSIGGNTSNTSPRGLFRAIKSVEGTKTERNLWDDLHSFFNTSDSYNLSNLISEEVILVKIYPMKVASNGISLERLSNIMDDIIIFQGKGYIEDYSSGSGVNHNFSLSELTFLEITVHALPKSQHAEWLSSSSQAIADEFLEKNGVKLSRLVPWYP